MASYPVEAASTRFRLTQFVSPLAERGISLTIRPFLDSRAFAALYDPSALPRAVIGATRGILGRCLDVLRAERADVVLIQREAMLFGPPFFEWVLTRAVNRPMVLDLDDATYIPYSSPTFGSITRIVRWFSKTDKLIRWARVVTCGNRTIAEYVGSRGAKACLFPSTVDTDQYHPLAAQSRARAPVVGWIGSHSTYPYLQSILPILERLGREHRFRLRVVGSGQRRIEVAGVPTENVTWSLDREISDYQSLDIGLYPIVPGQVAAGKSALKSVLYMAVGIPFVASPVGAAGETGVAGVTHLLAKSPDEWFEHLAELLSSANVRARMGAAGRAYAVQKHSLSSQSRRLADTLEEVARGRSR